MSLHGSDVWLLDKVCKNVDHCANHLSKLAEYKYRWGHMGMVLTCFIGALR